MPVRPVVLAFAVLVLAAGAAAAATPKHPAWTQNCKALNVKYPHGVGKAGARDHVKGRGEPVTTFRRSTPIYTTAVKHNGRLDADDDGVACEKA